MIMHYIGFDVLTAVVMKTFISLDVTSCSLVEVNRRYKLVACLTLVSCLDYSSVIKMEATNFSETFTFIGLHAVLSRKI
jgi:hypothetical protein